MAKRRQPDGGLPTFIELIIPTLKALKSLGGSGSIEEIIEKVIEVERIPDDVLQILHNDNGVQSEVEYRLAWSRTYLKKYGLLENSTRGVWSITDADFDIGSLDPNLMVKTVRDQIKTEKPKSSKSEDEEIDDQIEETADWKENLLNVLFNIQSDAFERLAQRLLRESGFVQVEVTGKSGDGGIDGKGIVKISGFLSFHVIFQCKRYRGTVTPSQIRDFRGAMQGRADKGIFITTGTFTRDAIREATRDGAPPIDLIDGELLCDKLQEYKLGVETKLIEKYEIIPEWFSKL